MASKAKQEERELVCHFIDNEGQKWQTEVTFQSVKRIKDNVGIDLLEITRDHAMLGEIMSDLYKLFEVAWEIVSPQAEGLGLTAEAFGERLAGDKIFEMRDAVGDGIIYFFAGPERMLLDRVVRAAREGEQKAKAKVMKEISGPKMDEAINEGLRSLDQKMKDALQRPRGSGYGNGPEPLE